MRGVGGVVRHFSADCGPSGCEGSAPIGPTMPALAQHAERRSLSLEVPGPERIMRAKHNAAPQLWISRVDADVRQLSSGDAIKIYNERGEFRAKAHVTDDVPPGVVWIHDGWVGLNHLTSGDAVLTGEALSLFPFSVGQADYGAQVEVSRS